MLSNLLIIFVSHTSIHWVPLKQETKQKRNETKRNLAKRNGTWRKEIETKRNLAKRNEIETK